MVLLGTDPNAIQPAMKKLFSGNWKQAQEIPLWDGHCAQRIIEILLSKVISQN